MPSLKDLRNRIASTKATQKITKAMQMVAASKLRRAQVAAEAARPYASRMDTVLGNIAASVAGADLAPRLLKGTGGNQRHLLLVCTAERGLCGPFNTAIVRLARERANALMGEGKEVKFFCVGRKGYDQLRRLYAQQIVELVDLRSVRVLGYQNAEMIAGKIIALFDKFEFDVCTLFYSRFRSVIAQIPTAQQIIPPVFDAPPFPPPQAEEGQGGGTARSTSLSRMRKISFTSCCHATSRCRFFGRCWRMPPRSTARRCPRWITPRGMLVT